MQYDYNATIRRVVDGDTVDLNVDLGFYMTAALRFRVLGVDTPELRGGTDETKAKAKLAKAFVEEKLFSATRIRVVTKKADSFGRWLGDVTYYSPHDNFSHNLAKELIEAGHGVERLR
jgi:micrococcal nuclease